MSWKCCIQYSSKSGKFSSGHRTGKKSVFIPISKKGNAKERSNYRTNALISHATKVILKIFQAKFQLYLNWELSDVQAGFREGRGTRDQIAYIRWIIEKESSRKTSTSASLTMLKPVTIWITTNWKTLKEMGIPDHFTCFLRNLYAGKKLVRAGHGTRD